MNYKDRFYSKYVSTQTSQLYGELNLSDFEKQFSVFKSYFGKFLPENKEANIVDLGCGNGDLVFWLQKIGFKNVSGVDYGKEQIELAKKFGVKNVVQADLKEFLKSKKEIFDVVFMRDVLEHFNKEEILEVMDLVFQSLEKGGIFVVKVPNAESPFGGRLRYGDFTHEISFTESSINQIFMVFGFNKVKIFGTPPVVHGTISLVRFIFWEIIELILKFYFLIETGSAKGIFTQNLIVSGKK
ncbi:methyltransferase domain-containing protein [Candidatus Wolfebacteria bacterium]|nr:methyltransferase domain-containing protein [Candidatus Wolfebacteria bacterium]